MTVYDFRARSDAAKFFNDEPSLTKQNFKDSCDINNILKKYTRAGVSPFCITKDAKFGDFSSILSYQDAVDLVNTARDSFELLPAKIRHRFSNDPGSLIDFLMNPENCDEAISLGLMEVLPDQNLPNDAEKNTAPATPVAS